MDKNTLYYGDNLDILRRYIDDESVDLIYLDMPAQQETRSFKQEPKAKGKKAEEAKLF